MTNGQNGTRLKTNGYLSRVITYIPGDIVAAYVAAVPHGLRYLPFAPSVLAATRTRTDAEGEYTLRDLPPGEVDVVGILQLRLGHVDQSIGKNTAAGNLGLIPPNVIIKDDFEELTIDGVRMVFQNTPGTEAPAEMNTYFPDMKAFWAAENITGTIHNIYTLRGALVRDALEWSKQINRAIYLFGQVRHEFTDPRAGLAMLIKTEDGSGHRQDRLVAGHAGQPLAFSHGIGQRFALLLVEKRLVIPSFEL